MKRNFTVNIQGTIFHIDEDAFALLNQYLDSIRAHFEGTEGSEEIYQDIESRIAEMLSARKGEQHYVVTIDDVKEVIAAMGQPYQIAGEEDERQEKKSETKSKRPKRLFRDIDNKIIGGVASGMAAYFGTDPIWFRLGFIVSFFATGPLLYIAFWIAMPAAVTTAEKLEMRGEDVNVANIEKSIRDEFTDIADRIKARTTKSKKKGGRESSSAHRVEDGLYALGYVFIRVVAIIVGFVIFIVGLSLLSALIASAILPTITIANHIDAVSLRSLLDMIYQDPTQANFIIWGVVLMIGVPTLLLMHAGIKMIFNLRYRAHYLGQIAGALFLIGLFFTVFSTIKLVDEFRREGTQKVTMSMNVPDSRVIYLQTSEINPGLESAQNHSKCPVIEASDMNWLQHPEFDIRKSPDDSIRLILIRSAKGESVAMATNNCSYIQYPVVMTDSTLCLPQSFTLESDAVWRLQRIKVLLEVPSGTILKPDFETDVLVDHGDNWHRFPSKFGGNTWLMTENQGLSPYLEHP